MLQAIYRKQSVRGRAWEIQILGSQAPTVGETVEVLKKSGGKDHVQVTNPFVRNGQIFASFVTLQRDVGSAPTVAISVQDFLSPQESAPQAVQNAPESIQVNAPPQSHIDAAQIADIRASMRGVVAKVIEARDLSDSARQRAEVAAGTAQSIALGIPKLAETAVREAAERAAKHPIIIKVDNVERKYEGAFPHPMLEKVLRLAKAGLNVMLVGEAGTGKTYLAHEIAKILGRRFGTLHCTAGMSESHISGYLLPTGDGGKFEYHPVDFVQCYMEGNSLFLLDEVDAADPNVLMFMNGALANGALHIPHRLQGSHVSRGPNQTIMAAANTFGHGANARYQGRNALDGATLDRFYVVEMDYDDARERAMFGSIGKKANWTAAEAPTANELRGLGEWVLSLRERTRKAQLRRIVSSRTLDKALTARKAGIPTTEVIRDVLAGWTADEKAKVGE